MMTNGFKRAILFLLTLCVLASGIVAAQAEPAQGAQAAVIDTSVSEIQKYGNLILAVTGSDVLNAGYAYGDMIAVTVNGQTLRMPLCSKYGDVDTGENVLRVLIDPAAGTDMANIAINMGDFATTLGLAVKTKTEEEPGYRWDLCEGVTAPVSVTLALGEAGAYYDEWLIRQLVRTNERGDYAALTDAQFANFRAVATSGMGANVLYRSSSPVNPGIGRSAYADAAAKAAGIRTCVNLADTDQAMRAYEGWADTYYSACEIIGLNLGVDFAAPDFAAGLAEGLRFLIGHDAPYLVHCSEGKDRAGFVSALLECLMGAAPGEVVADYMTTYVLYYGMTEGSEQYDAVASSNIIKALNAAFDIDDLFAAGVDLAAEARDYLLSIGLLPSEIDALQAKLR